MVITSSMRYFMRFSITVLEVMKVETFSKSHESGNFLQKVLQNLIEPLRIKVVPLAYLASQAFTLFCALWVPFLWASPAIHLEDIYFIQCFFFFSFIRKAFMISKPLNCPKQKCSLFYLIVFILLTWLIDLQ